MIPSRKGLMLFALLLLTTVLLSLGMTMPVTAAAPLSQEYHLETPYNYITNTDVCAGDVDGDGVIEIIGIGYGDDGTGTRGYLAIGTWDGEDAGAEKAEQIQVDGMIGTWAFAVDIGDLDGDGLLEIVVAGYCWDVAHQNSWVRVYRWTGTTLSLLDTETWTVVAASSEDVAVGDLDGDGTPEIVTCGWATVDSTTVESQLRVWSWGAGLHLEASKEWNPSPWSECVGVALGELDGEVRIATASLFEDSGGEFWGHVGVWSYGSDLTLEDSEEWKSVWVTAALGVFIDDNKIYTAGYAHGGICYRGQLRVWSSSLTVEDSEEWYIVGHTWASDVFVADVDGDGEKEVVTGGLAHDGTRYNAQLRVWSQDSPLTLEDSEEWYDTDSTEIWAVFAGDVDQDGVNEILTAGYGNDHKLAQLTVWSYPDNTDPSITGLTPADGSEVSTGKPTISTTLSDDYSGIDLTSVSMKVGGTDVTSQATVTETGVTYTPTSDLEDGDHTVVVKVSDRSGNEATATWTFKVKKAAPAIPGFPLEGIMVGIAAAAAAVFLLRKKTTQGIPTAPST